MKILIPDLSIARGVDRQGDEQYVLATKIHVGFVVGSEIGASCIVNIRAQRIKHTLNNLFSISQTATGLEQGIVKGNLC